MVSDAFASYSVLAVVRQPTCIFIGLQCFVIALSATTSYAGPARGMHAGEGGQRTQMASNIVESGKTRSDASKDLGNSIVLAEKQSTQSNRRPKGTKATSNSTKSKSNTSKSNTSKGN